MTQNLKSVNTSKKGTNLPDGRTRSEGLTPLWDLGSDQLPTLAHGWLAATTKTITVKPLTGHYNDGDCQKRPPAFGTVFPAACTKL